MDELEKNNVNPEGSDAPEEKEPTGLGSLFKAWANATEEDLLAKADAEKAEREAKKKAEAVEEAVAETAAETTAETVNEAVETAETVIDTVNEATKTVEEKSEEVVEKVEAKVETPNPSEKKINYKLFGIIGGAVALLLIIIAIVVSIKPSINLNDYIVVDYDGCNGYATAKVYVDYNKLEADYGKKIEVKAKINTGLAQLDNLFGEMSKMISLSDVVKSCSRITFNPNKNLKNGDKIEVNVTLQTELFEESTNGKIKGSNYTVTVEGLKNPIEYDAFEDVEVTLEGYSGKGVASFEVKKSAKVDNLRFNLSDTAYLSNGDEIVLSVSNGDWAYDSAEAQCLAAGYKLKETEKKIKVSGLKEYEQVDLFENLKIEFDGYDGIGTAEIDASDVNFGEIEFRLDRNTELSNGDTVLVTAYSTNWSYTVVDLLNNDGKTTDITEKEYKVEGLEKAKEYDPFKELEFVYTGISPSLKLEVNTADVSVEGLRFELSKNRDIANGDEITVKVSSNDWKYDAAGLCLQEGYVLNDTEYTFNVEEQTYYCEDIDEISDETIEKLDDEARDVIKAYVASTWNKPESLKGVELSYVYFLSPKSREHKLTNYYNLGGELHNMIYLVYTIKAESKSGEKFEFVLPVEYANLAITSDGDQEIDILKSRYDFNQFRYDGLYYKGFEELSGFETKCVETEAANYNSVNKVISEDEEEPEETSEDEEDETDEESDEEETDEEEE